MVFLPLITKFYSVNCVVFHSAKNRFVIPVKINLAAGNDAVADGDADAAFALEKIGVCIIGGRGEIMVVKESKKPVIKFLIVIQSPIYRGALIAGAIFKIFIDKTRAEDEF